MILVTAPQVIGQTRPHSLEWNSEPGGAMLAGEKELRRALLSSVDPPGVGDLVRYTLAFFHDDGCGHRPCQKREAVKPKLKRTQYRPQHE